MDWFEEWFDSPLYERLYANRDEEEAARLGKLLREIIPVDRFPKVLDLGCGRGRHSLYLARHGYQVTGIDLSEQAIKTAREKASGMGLDNVSFEVMDMRYPVNDAFDAVINLFTTFGYFEEDEENIRVLDAQSSVIRSGGKMIIDFMNSRKVRKEFEPVSEGDFGDFSYIVHRTVKGDVIRKEIKFRGEQLDGPKKYFERVKLYEPEWFKQKLIDRGFSIEHVYGDYKGSEFDAENCDRFIIVAKKG